MLRSGEYKVTSMSKKVLNYVIACASPLREQKAEAKKLAKLYSQQDTHNKALKGQGKEKT